MILETQRAAFSELLSRLLFSLLIPFYAAAGLAIWVRILFEMSSHPLQKIYFAYHLILIGALLIWRFGKWGRFQLRHYWDSTTPPHPPIEKFDSIPEVWRFLAIGHSLPDREYDVKSGKSSISVGLALYTLASGLYLIGGIGASLIPVQDLPAPSVGGASVSVISAFTSVILGPLFGGILLFLSVFSQSLGSGIILLLALGVPTIALAPALQNFQHAIETLNYWVVTRFKEDGVDPSRALLILSALYLMSVGSVGLLLSQ